MRRLICAFVVHKCLKTCSNAPLIFYTNEMANYSSALSKLAYCFEEINFTQACKIHFNNVNMNEIAQKCTTSHHIRMSQRCTFPCISIF